MMTANRRKFDAVFRNDCRSSRRRCSGRRFDLRASRSRSEVAVLTAGMQMFSGGLVLLVVSFILGEPLVYIAEVSAEFVARIDISVDVRLAHRFYGYSWLLKNAQPAMVATLCLC